jgi:hypothetical protein
LIADRLQRVTKVFQGYVDSGQLPGAVVLIARNGKVAYQQAFGYQDREQNASMAMNSIFRIASMTKPLVSVGVMMLVEEESSTSLRPYFSTCQSSKISRWGPKNATLRAETPSLSSCPQSGR